MTDQKKSAQTAATVQDTQTVDRMQTVSSAAQQIDNGIVSLELASDLFQILSESFESEFESVRPESALEDIYLKRLNLYNSAVTIFQTSMTTTLSELRNGCNSLYDKIREVRATV
jgi:hypothetical protein